MPWTTPALRTVREMVRNDVTAALSGAVLIANSVARVMSDAMAGLAHLVLRYIDWLSLQLLPDTAESEWLDRHDLAGQCRWHDGAKGRGQGDERSPPPVMSDGARPSAGAGYSLLTLTALGPLSPCSSS